MHAVAGICAMQPSQCIHGCACRSQAHVHRLTSNANMHTPATPPRGSAWRRTISPRTTTAAPVVCARLHHAVSMHSIPGKGLHSKFSPAGCQCMTKCSCRYHRCTCGNNECMMCNSSTECSNCYDIDWPVGGAIIRTRMERHSEVYRPTVAILVRVCECY